MIDVAQLRIGNWIYNDYKYPEKISPYWFYCYYKNDDTVMENTFIPITPDLLLDSGFVDYANNGWGMRLYIDATTELFWGIQERKVKYQTRGSGFTIDFGIEYVHQLQNLYFVLTKKELEIKL